MHTLPSKIETNVPTKATTPMKELYGRLHALGVKKNYVRDVILPSWWDDEIATQPSGFAQALGFVSRSLGFTPSELSAQTLEWSEGSAKFKTREGLSADDVTASATIALRAGALAAYAAKTPTTTLPESGAEVRAELLSDAKPWIDLEVLLDYCWSKGIVVLHLSNFPEKKMDGLASIVEGRPVIVVSRKDFASGKLLFILAHELGHLGRRHVTNEAHVDVDDAFDSANTDSLEKEANAYAFEILTGVPVPTFPEPARPHYCDVLTAAAIQQGRTKRVAPSTITLQWAWNRQVSWPHAIPAVKVLERDCADPAGIFHRKMREHLDLDRLPEESVDFLMRVSRCDT